MSDTISELIDNVTFCALVQRIAETLMTAYTCSSYPNTAYEKLLERDTIRLTQLIPKQETFYGLTEEAKNSACVYVMRETFKRCFEILEIK